MCLSGWGGSKNLQIYRVFLVFVWIVWVEKGKVWLLINLANYCMVLVEIPKRSHLFGEGDVYASVGGYG